MLYLLLVATDCVDNARLMAIRIWLSAALCADWLCDIFVGFAFWEWRWHFIIEV